MIIKPRPWRVMGPPTRSRHFRVFMFIALIVGSVHLFHISSSNRQALRLKYRPTLFPRLSTDEQATLQDESWLWWSHEQQQQQHVSSSLLSISERATSVSQFRQSLVEKRDAWTSLGHGFEGHTFTYLNHVIKKFKRGQSPFRNCVPGYLPEVRWPTEISASLVLGGAVPAPDDENNTDTTDSSNLNAAEGHSLSENAAFLPVVDYFLAPSALTSGPEDGHDEEGSDGYTWHLVTPFLPHGNLKRLAKKLHGSDVTYVATDVDTIFRPSLDHLVEGLRQMHEEYELCHDDVKLDNIFLAAPAGSSADTDHETDPREITHWLLGDLGNVRERDHEYHSSMLWASHGNLQDCRANDVYRLLKVYIIFLSLVVDDKEQFDREFFEASQPWSRLFWFAHRRVKDGSQLAGADVLEQSKYGDSPASAVGKSDAESHENTKTSQYLMSMLGSSGIASSAREDVLELNNGETNARLLGLVPFLGVPSSSCWVE